MNATELCWFATSIYALKALERLMFDWREWAKALVTLPVGLGGCVVSNDAVIVVGILTATIADAFPAIALMFPPVRLVNAMFFQLGSFVVTQGQLRRG